MTSYKEDLVNGYWDYQRRFFPDVQRYFERPFAPDGRPPVFLKHHARLNIIVNPNATQNETRRLFDVLRGLQRHRWFGSMNSSQALAWSVLANLKTHYHLNLLAEINGDDGEPLLGKAQVSPESLVIEHKINYLGEPRPTSLDALVSGPYQVAIECKFTEAQVGACSRPRLKPWDPKYKTEFCNGSFSRQLGRKERCSLIGIRVLYWKYVPELFTWNSNIDLNSCPLHENYQLVRNILAACVRSKGTVSAEYGHVAVIYDERNPAFRTGGHCFSAFRRTQQALKVPGLLKKCCWQRIIRHLKERDVLPWLVELLRVKYGLL